MSRCCTPTKAFIAPFGGYVLLFALGSLIEGLFKHSPAFLATHTQYWVYPLQAVVCGSIIVYFWKSYDFGPIRKLGLTIGIAILVFVIWVAPQVFFNASPRNVGFDPTLFSQNQWMYHAVLAFRFLRLVVVVPLMEEIFWRGFLLRDFINNEDFTQVPFGTYTRNSCLLVALAFAMAHWGPDFVPALITGGLYNLVAYRTRSLASCVLAHSLTNLLLGGYIMQSKQWGFW